MTAPLRHDALASLALERDYWRERALQAEAALEPADVDWVPRAWGLTRAEARILNQLIRFQSVSKTAILGITSMHRDRPSENVYTASTHISRMRRKLDRRGILILTWRGVGYHLAASTRDRLRKMQGAGA